MGGGGSFKRKSTPHPLGNLPMRTSQCLSMSLQITMSNWESSHLDARQIRYAAMDALVTGDLFRALRQLHANPTPCPGRRRWGILTVPVEGFPGFLLHGRVLQHEKIDFVDLSFNLSRGVRGGAGGGGGGAKKNED